MKCGLLVLTLVHSKGRRKNKLESFPIPGLWTLLVKAVISNKHLIIAHSESKKYWAPARYWVNQILSKNWTREPCGSLSLRKVWTRPRRGSGGTTRTCWRGSIRRRSTFLLALSTWMRMQTQLADEDMFVYNITGGVKVSIPEDSKLIMEKVINL